jgi:hypothetical protein
MGGRIVTAFFLKRPGQLSDEAETIAGHSDSWPASTWADRDEWALSLPHSCDAWVIGSGSLADVLEEAREFRALLDEAIRRLEQEARG